MSSSHHSASEARYRRILSSQREGEPVCALADRHGVNRQTLYWWRQRLAREGRGTAADSERPAASHELVPVDLSPGLLALGAVWAPGFEVALRQSGHMVRVPASFDPAALLRLVDALERK